MGVTQTSTLTVLVVGSAITVLLSAGAASGFRITFGIDNLELCNNVFHHAGGRPVREHRLRGAPGRVGAPHMARPGTTGARRKAAPAAPDAPARRRAWTSRSPTGHEREAHRLPADGGKVWSSRDQDRSDQCGEETHRAPSHQRTSSATSNFRSLSASASSAANLARSRTRLPSTLILSIVRMVIDP
jgi:hypothetical protein